MKNQELEEMIKQAMSSMDMGGQAEKQEEAERPRASGENLSRADYPLIKERPELIQTPTNKKVEDIGLENIMSGEVTSRDLKIRPETLNMQAEIADSDGRGTVANNLRRAAELIAVPDNRLLEIYNALRPNRSTKEELLEIAEELEAYNCQVNARLIREAADVYEKRNILRKN